MGRTGIIKRVPKDLIDEVNSIKADLNLDSDVEAFHEVQRYTAIGREMERISNLWLPIKRRKP